MAPGRATALGAVVVAALVAAGCASSGVTAPPSAGAGSAAGSSTAPATAPASIASGVATSAAPGPMTNVGFILNFLAGGPQAGFTYAKQLGYYAQEGLNVTIQEGQGSASTAQLTATGQTPFGYSDGPSTMAVRAKGGPVTIIAPILQTNAFAVISLAKSNITSLADLVGKSVAVQPGTAQTTLLDPLLKGNNIDPSKLTVVNIAPAALVSTLLQGKVDAILAGADFQAVQIEDQGYKINEQFYADYGVPTVGLSIIANDSYLKQHPDVAKKFVDASLRGWAAAQKNPAAAAQSMVTAFPAATQKQILEQLNVDLKFVCAKGATALGVPPESVWTKTDQLLTQYLSLPTSVPITDYYSTQYLPANPPAC